MILEHQLFPKSFPKRAGEAAGAKRVSVVLGCAPSAMVVDMEVDPPVASADHKQTPCLNPTNRNNNTGAEHQNNKSSKGDSSDDKPVTKVKVEPSTTGIVTVKAKVLKEEASKKMKLEADEVMKDKDMDDIRRPVVPTRPVVRVDFRVKVRDALRLEEDLSKPNTTGRHRGSEAGVRRGRCAHRGGGPRQETRLVVVVLEEPVRAEERVRPPHLAPTTTTTTNNNNNNGSLGQQKQEGGAPGGGGGTPTRQNGRRKSGGGQGSPTHASPKAAATASGATAPPSSLG